MYNDEIKIKTELREKINSIQGYQNSILEISENIFKITNEQKSDARLNSTSSALHDFENLEPDFKSLFEQFSETLTRLEKNLEKADISFSKADKNSAIDIANK